MTLRNKFAWTIFSLQFIFIIIYGIFAKYGPDVDVSDPKHNISPESGGQRPKDNILNKDYPRTKSAILLIKIKLHMRKLKADLLNNPVYPEDWKATMKFIRDFSKWLADEEKKTNSKYFAASSEKYRDHTYTLFKCNRSGTFKSKAKIQKKQLKAQGSVKIGHHCTSSIIKKDFASHTEVSYFGQHYKHDKELKYVPIPQEDRQIIAVFQDINAMIFIGIGFLYAFLRKYSYTGVGMNFLLCAIGVQWGMITKGVWNMRNGKLDIDVTSLVQGEFAAASGMIALGGIFGKAGLIQMVAFVIIEIFVYSSTDYFSHNYLQVSDVGESVALHLFAAVFGCSAAYTLDKKVNVKGNPNESTSYNSNLFCILGTVVLWVYWPSFNSAGDEGDSQHRNVINTFLGLLGSAITCFAMSSLLNKKSKFTMSHIQNGALAGAVGVGSTSNLMIQPFGALAIGALSGCLSVAGFKYFSPLLGKFNIYDPCGINSLHGLPGLFAGILGILATFLADKETYGSSLYKFYPAMAPLTNTTELYELQANSTIKIEPGIGRTIEYQALYQFIYILVTIAISCLTGLITGAILRMRIFDPIEDKQMYIDDIMWELPDIEADQQTEERKLSQMSAKL